jgi:hypothetical protein
MLGTEARQRCAETSRQLPCTCTPTAGRGRKKDGNQGKGPLNLPGVEWLARAVPRPLKPHPGAGSPGPPTRLGGPGCSQATAPSPPTPPTLPKGLCAGRPLSPHAHLPRAPVLAARPPPPDHPPSSRRRPPAWPRGAAWHPPCLPARPRRLPEGQHAEAASANEGAAPAPAPSTCRIRPMGIAMLWPEPASHENQPMGSLSGFAR